MAQGRYKFEDRRHAGGGVTATVCSGISAGIFAVMAVICMLLQGQGAPGSAASPWPASCWPSAAWWPA